MSKHVTLAAFLATLAVVVPAAWHAPDADIASDGPQLRPKQGTLELDDATVTVDLDRGVLMSGGKLVATIVATADTPRKIALDVRALQDNGMGEGRVSNPPTEVARRRITVEAAPGGGKPTEVAFDLKPRGMKPGNMEWFDIQVTAASNKRAKKPANDEGEEELASAATAGAVVWGGNNLAMRLEAPAAIPAGDVPFTVKVHVKNTAKKPIQYVDLKLGGPGMNYNGMEGLSWYGDDSYEVEPIEVEATGDEGGDDSIAPGASRTYAFQVTSKVVDAARLALLVKASATVVIDEERNKYLSFGAIETTTISLTKSEPAAPAEPVVTATATAAK